MSELLAKIKAGWFALWQKRTIVGWILFSLSLLLRFSDRWDSVQSVFGKLKSMGGFFSFLVSAAHSLLVQLTIFVAGVLWIGIAAIVSARKTGGSYDAVTFEKARIVPIGGNLEQKINRWIDEHGFKHGNVPHGIQVLIPPRFITTIGRQKNRPSWLMLESSILMSEKHQALFAKMSKEQKMSIFRAIRIECGRSEVEHHLHNDGSRRLVCIQKQVPIADLTESQVVDSINKMHFAADVLMDTMDTLMPPDKVLAGIANSEGDTTPKAAIELLDDLLVEGAVIEKFCGDMCDGEIAKSKVEPWIAKVRSALRNNAPDYVAAFNDTVSRGTTGRLHPLIL